jgi:hypothetical protein
MVEAKYPIIGNIGFAEEWSFNDWKGGPWLEHIRYWKLASYEPLDPTIRERATQKWNDLEAAANGGDEAASNLREKWKVTLSSAFDAVDRNTKTADALGRYSDEGHRERAYLLTTLNNKIREFANLKIPQTSPPPSSSGPASAPPSGPAFPPPGGGSVPGFSPSGFKFRNQMWPGGISSSGAAQQGVGQQGEKKIPTALLAMGAVAVLGVGVWLIKRKKGR